MKRVWSFVFAGLALSAVVGCGDNGFTVVVGTNQATVRFVNAISGLNSNLALTANGSIVGAAQGFAQFSTTCTTVNAGNTTFAFGTPNSSGTDIANSFATTTFPLTNGKYLVIATGTTTTPQFLILPAASTVPPSGTVNVRFVNATGVSAIDVFATANGTIGTTPTAASIGTFSAGTFSNIATTSNTLTFRTSGTTTTVLTVSDVPLQSGGTYTIMLLPNASGTGLQMLIINSACG